ncbi:lycopene beta-cyclase CrtY [Aureimonas sp. Leaf324]|jgi:lycopene beta-cyclase|uniref:lycopene beta-cyclase CrtY n=1 Tax=Aureimonas sp. Leaf324 TaxID=1736336 RepID=UPI0006F2448D|nr:lycopene beta-cyclase CrtY [Aureimonas sp. Leaf324]KQQ81192.1 lycopene cyclase [Aureimonas sp. Leaf324]
MSLDADLILLGGGLANGLIAFRLAMRRPDLKVLVVEGGEALGGNHTWSFHDGDLSTAEQDWVAPLVSARWADYDVRFPGRRRRFATGYASVSSERFREVIAARLGERLLTGVPAVAVTPNAVTLADQRTLTARAVIDGRGARQSPHLDLGFQKFLGQEWEFDRPHGVERPVIMDATVPQRDGYRFVYLLPFSPTRLLVEDTYYADRGDLDVATLRGHLADYAAAANWGEGRLVREEHGILPIALGGDIDALIAAAGGMPTVGLAHALFHPTTGYSLPDAVHVADLVSRAPDISPEGLSRLLDAHARNIWSDRSYFRMLNRLLFQAGRPEERYRILEHFHRLPEDLVARFYAARLDFGDKVRILAGKPPVPVLSALRVLAARRPKESA